MNYSEKWKTLFQSRMESNLVFISMDESRNITETNPEICQLWHPTKNGDLCPKQFTRGQHIKVWWKCSKVDDHEWQAAIYNMAKKKSINKRGQLCPICNGKKAGKTNNFAYKYPEISRQWHPTKNGTLKPSDVAPYSNIPVWWRCENHPEEDWYVPPGRRASGKGCRFCANQAVNKSNSLATMFPKLAKQWHPTKNEELKRTPETISAASGMRVWWQCPVGIDHVWITSVYSRSRNGAECPFCKNKKVSITNNLEKLFPDIAAEWHPTKNGSLTPSGVVPGSHRSVWWQCPRSVGHIFKKRVDQRTQREQSCPQCTHQTSRPEIRIYTECLKLFDHVRSRYKVGSKEIDIFVKEIDLGIEYDGCYYHAGKEKRDRSKTKFMEEKGITIIRVREEPLNKLSDRDVIVRDNRISKADLNALMQAVIENTSSRQLRSKLEDYLVLDEFVNEDDYKKYISFLPSPFPENSLQEKNPELARQWHVEKNFPLTPFNFTEKSGKKVWWVCDKNAVHEWETTIAHRSAGKGCPFCAGQKVDQTNSLAVLFPDIAAQWHPIKNGALTPSDVVARSSKAVWWQCSKVDDHEWKISPGVRVKGHGCAKCAIARRSTLKVQPLNKRFETYYPDLLKEWDHENNGVLKPEHITKGSNRKINWVCQKDSGHKWSATVHNRGKNKSGCPHCYNLKRSRKKS